MPARYEFTATLFDLIRRGVYKAEPATTERPIWGGLRNAERSPTSRSRPARAASCGRGSGTVANVVDGVLDGRQ